MRLRSIAIGPLALGATIVGAAEPEPDVAATKQTMARMRVIVSAIDRYRADFGHVPFVPGDGRPAAEALAPVLVPTYLREVPATDGWGAALRWYRQFGEDCPKRPRPACDAYRLVSSGEGRDGDDIVVARERPDED